MDIESRGTLYKQTFVSKFLVDCFKIYHISQIECLKYPLMLTWYGFCQADVKIKRGKKLSKVPSRFRDSVKHNIKQLFNSVFVYRFSLHASPYIDL